MRDQGIGGYTLIELLITLSISSILGIFSIYGFGKLISNVQQFNAIHETITALSRARTLAVQHNERVGFCSLANDQTCSGNWDGDYFIGFIDRNRNQSYDSTEEIVFQQPWSSNQIHARWSNRLANKAITYQENGRIVSNGTLYLSDKNGNVFAKLVINNSGRVRTTTP